MSDERLRMPVISLNSQWLYYVECGYGESPLLLEAISHPAVSRGAQISVGLIFKIVRLSRRRL
jgi:hypothetical protein